MAKKLKFPKATEAGKKRALQNLENDKKRFVGTVKGIFGIGNRTIDRVIIVIGNRIGNLKDRLPGRSPDKIKPTPQSIGGRVKVIDLKPETVRSVPAEPQQAKRVTPSPSNVTISYPGGMLQEQYKEPAVKPSPIPVPVEEEEKPEQEAKEEDPKEKRDKEKFQDLGQKLRDIFSNKWLKIGIGVFFIAVFLLIVILLFGNSKPGTTYNIATQVPPPAQVTQPASSTPAPAWIAPPVTIQPTVRTSLHGLDLKVDLLSLGFVLIILFSLLESVARGDFILLDFFACWGLVALFEFGQIYHDYSTWTWGVFFGAGMLGMGIATLWNPSEENEPEWWNRIDTTHWYVAGLALIIIYLMKSTAIPYPTYIPIIVPILVAVVGIGKEIFRQTLFCLAAIAIGIVPAVLQTPVALAIGLTVETLLTTFAQHQGYITSRGTGHTLKIGGREVNITLDWDIVLFYIAEVMVIGYALYGNYVILAIRR